MEVQGFCMLNSDANFKHTMGDPKGWIGKPLAAMEINDSTQSVLLIKGVEMGMFDFKDVRSSFKCQKTDIYLFPEGLNMIEQMMYMSYITNRNGGYSPLLMNMVIMHSLHRKEFCDSVLWMKGQDPDLVAGVKALQELAKSRTVKV